VKASLIVLLFLALLGANATAQTLPDVTGTAGSTEEAQTAPEPDPLGRDTPQGLVAGLVEALADGDHERAARFFESTTIRTSGGRVLTGAVLVKEFQEVLDRTGQLATPGELSSAPAGQQNDGLAADLERVGTLSGPAGYPDLPLLAKRVEVDGRPVWLVSEQTLQQVAVRAAAVMEGLSTRLIEYFPSGPTFLGVPASNWVAIVVLACLSFAFAWVLSLGRWLVVAFVTARYGGSRLTRFINASAGPIRLLIAVIVFVVAAQLVGLTVVARYNAFFVAQVVSWVAIVWLLWSVTDAAADFTLSQMSRRGQLTAYSAVSFTKRAVKAVFGLIFIAVLLNAYGVNITAGVAALGIGGLAIALGAQKLFENLIGSLTLIADRPIRIGDFCRFGEMLGTVEDIGIRSTRIRTLNRTVVTVPNGEFASLHIENYTQRDQFLFRPTLNLRYETSTDQLRYVLQELRAMLYAHPRVDPVPARVRFISLGSHSLDVEPFAYVNAADYSDFLEVQEDLLLRCMEIVEKSGTGFAFPSQTLYLGRDGGLDEDKRSAAESAVRGWREKGELQVPRFTEEEIHRLRGTIDYPPRGAATADKSGS
jgi:MscS family membrane protein